VTDRPECLSDDEVRERLAALGSWTYSGRKLHREYRFGDFSEAFGFMARAALAAEKLGHHPDWSNSWSKVIVDLTTHDAGGVTELDLLLAVEMERISVRP
jgi:4a-hydroxytetrahydrobiopterin dehydratase